MKQCIFNVLLIITYIMKHYEAMYIQCHPVFQTKCPLIVGLRHCFLEALGCRASLVIFLTATTDCWSKLCTETHRYAYFRSKLKKLDLYTV